MMTKPMMDEVRVFLAFSAWSGLETPKSMVKPETIIIPSKIMPAKEKTIGRRVEMMPGRVLTLSSMPPAWLS